MPSGRAGAGLAAQGGRSAAAQPAVPSTRADDQPSPDHVGEERLDVGPRPVGIDAEDIGHVRGEVVRADRAVEQRPQQRPGALEDVGAAGAVDGENVALHLHPGHVGPDARRATGTAAWRRFCTDWRGWPSVCPSMPRAGNTCSIWCSVRATAAATASSNEPSTVSRPDTADTRPRSRIFSPTVSVRLRASGAAPSQHAPTVSIPTKSMPIVVPVAGATRNPRWLPTPRPLDEDAVHPRRRLDRTRAVRQRRDRVAAGDEQRQRSADLGLGQPPVVHDLPDVRAGQRAVGQPLDERPIERLVEAHRPARERDLAVRLVFAPRPGERDGIDEPPVLGEPKRRQPAAEDVGAEHPVDAEVRQGLAQHHVGSGADHLAQVRRHRQADDRAGWVGLADERALGGSKVVGDLAEHQRVERAAEELVGHVRGVVGADPVEVRLLARPEGERAGAVLRKLLDGRHGRADGHVGTVAVARHVEPQRLLDRQEVGPAARHRVAHVGEPTGGETSADYLDDVAPVLGGDPAVDAVEGDHVDLTGPGLGRAGQFLERRLFEGAVGQVGGRGVLPSRATWAGLKS